MKFKVALAFFVITALWAVNPLFAHHSFAAEYDADKPIQIRGKVTKIEFVNPHAWLYMDVKDKDTGKTVNYAVEFGSPNAMIRNGIRKDSVPIGSEVIIDGWMAKNGTPTVNSKTMTFLDGRRLFTGTSNTAVPDTGAAPAPAQK